MPELAYVNGKYGTIEDAVVSIDDRGFQFGDGVYEVLYVFGGRLFLFDEHLARLKNSLDGLAIRGVDMNDVRAVMSEMVARSGFDRAKLYYCVTRGVAPRNHPYPAGVKPSIHATIRPVTPPPAEEIAKGLRAVTIEDFRWGRCDLKTLNLLGNVLAKQQALDSGFDEAIFYGADGVVREATAANVFAVDGGVVYTYPIGPRILPGITRDLVVKLARETGVPMREEGMTLDKFRRADEIFLTGTTAELIAITQLDGETVGSGGTGPVTARLRAAYDRYVESFLASA